MTMELCTSCVGVGFLVTGIFWSVDILLCAIPAGIVALGIHVVTAEIASSVLVPLLVINLSGCITIGVIINSF